MSVKIPFTADIRGFEKGLSEMRAKYKGFGDFLKKNRKALILGGGTLALGAFATGFKKAASEASDLINMSKEAKTNVEALQVALLLGSETGAAQEQVVAALKNINSRSVDAANGAKSYQDALTRLNIDFKNFVDIPTERKLEMIAKGYVQTGEDAQAYRDILTLLGEDAGPKLIGVLQRLGSEGFGEVAKQMKESGKIIETEFVESLNSAEKAAEDAFERIWGTIKKGYGKLAILAGVTENKDATQDLRDNLADTLTGGFFDFTGKTADARVKKALRNIEIQERIDELDKIINPSGEKEKKVDGRKKLQAEKGKNDFIAGIFNQAKKDASGMDKDRSKLESSIGKLKSSVASVPVSSLQAIGGGGNVSSVGMSQVQILRSQEQLLRQIVKNTEYKGQGPMQEKGATAG